MPPQAKFRFRLNAAPPYIEVMNLKIFPWLKEVTNGRNYVFQQEEAPVQTSILTKNYLCKNASFQPKSIWPPFSPDLSPLALAFGCMFREKPVLPAWSSIRSVLM